MTERAYARMTRRGREYTDRGTGEVYLSVTSVLSAAHPFDGGTWSSYMAGDLLLNEWDRIVTLHDADPASARAYLATAAKRYSTRRADIGSAVHSSMESFFKGLPYPTAETYTFDRNRTLDEEGWSEVRVIWAQLKDFLERVEFKPWRVEPLTVSRKFGYAGSADLIGESTLWEGIRVVDLKTKAKRASARPEVVLQLSAYANADVVLEENGLETDLAGIIDQERGAVFVASSAGVEPSDVILNFPLFQVMQRAADYWHTGDTFIQPFHTIAVDTTEDVHADITEAQTVEELTALYLRHKSRDNWRSEHTTHAAQRKEEINGTAQGK